MTATEITNGRPASGGYKVDVSRGGHNGRVSSEWFSRPDDEKHLSLSELYASVKRRAECLNAHWFLTLVDAREKMEDWRRHYNEDRPHSAIGYNVPVALHNPGDNPSPSPC